MSETQEVPQEAIVELETPENGREPAPPSDYTLPRAVQPQPVPPGATLKDPALYFNQELAWIDFNWRVLYQALDERTPLLERVRFVAITANNLDEFVQKRIGGLKRQEAAGVRELSVDGLYPRRTAHPAERRGTAHAPHHDRHLEETLRPALRAEAGIDVCDYDDLSPWQQEMLHTRFQQDIYPILTPLTVDPGHPFPFISNLSLSLAVILEHPQQGTTHFARLKIPTGRWIDVPEEGPAARRRLLPVEQLIARHAGELFPGMIVSSVHPFRITRNADVSRDEEVADDLLAMISSELRERRFASVVRFEVAHGMPYL